MPIRILQIVSSLNKGSGVNNVIFNWHKNIDREKIQFDYLYFLNAPFNFEKEIKDLGGNVYKLPYPSISNLYIFIKSTVKFFKSHKYKTIHSHITQFNLFFFPIAKFFGTKNIILHVHNPKYSDYKIKALVNKLMLMLVRIFITQKIACSEKSGFSVFGKKTKFTIINNAVNINEFKFNEEIRIKIRKEINLENKFIIGNVGRFVVQKNHDFLIDIFSEINKSYNNAFLLLVGTGPLESNIKSKIKLLNLEKKVLFAGLRQDMSNLYNIMDFFVFPSIFEGFGLVAVEAQSSGLPCLISDAVPDNINVINTTVLSLNSSPKKWADLVCQKIKTFQRKDESDKIIKAGFDIKTVAEKIENIYMEIEK